MGGFTGLQIPGATPQPIFDMSKAVPLTPQEHPLFDMSKAQPIFDPDAFMASRQPKLPASLTSFDPDSFMATRAALKSPEPEQGFWRGSPSIPGQAIQESSTMSPQKMKEGAVTAGKTALAGAAAGSAAIGAAGLLAPTIGTEVVGTGILDAAGEEITKDIATQGPSLARAGINAAVNVIKSHPIISGYVATHLANALGIPLPKILKAIAGIGEVAE